MRPPAAPLAGFFLLLHCACPAKEVTLAGHQFRIPEGFTIEVAASPELADRPVNACLAPDGRLFVTVSSGSTVRPVENQNQDPRNRVICLQDTTGSGVYNKATVFAENVPFPEGILWFENAVYVAAPPAIWKFTDTDGDNVSDRREKWYDGKTITGCANDLHGPYAGPDGYLYWTKGAFAEQEIPHFRSRTPRKDRAAHILRARPDGSELEAVMSGGMDNPVGLDFSSTGDLLFSSTFIDLSGDGKRDGLGHAVRGAVFPKINDVTHDVPRTGPLLPALTHYGAGAPSGITRLRSKAFGLGDRELILAALFNLQKVVLHQLEPHGSTFRSTDTDFVVSDNRDFHPTDVLEDSDGSVLIVDTGGWYKVCCPTSQLAKPEVLGAIYRIRRDAAPRPVDPYGVRIPFQTASADRLVEYLGDPRIFVREKAVRELATRRAEGIEALQGVLKSTHPDPALPLTALRSLFLNGSVPAREIVRQALTHPLPQVRILAARYAGIQRDAAAIPALTSMLQPESSVWAESARRVAVESLGQLGLPACVSSLFESHAARRGDVFFEHSVIFALTELNDAASVRNALHTFRDPASQRAGLISLSEMPGGNLTPADVLPHLLAANDVLRDTAVFLAARHPEWGGAVAAHLTGKLVGPEPPLPRPVLEELLARMVRDPAIQELISSLCKAPPVWCVITGLNTMAASGLKAPPAFWADTLADLLQRGPGPEATCMPLINATRNAMNYRPFRERLIPALEGFCEAPALPASVRILAAAALPVNSNVPELAFDAAASLLAVEGPLSERLAAADLLGRSILSHSQRERLVSQLSEMESVAAARILPGLTQGANETTLDSILSALLRTPDKAALSAAVVRSALQSIPSALTAKRERLLTRLDATTEQQRNALLELEKSLPAGDVSRGRTVFNSMKASCSLCHKQGFQGGKLGPDLTAIGSIRSRTDLLEAIVFPSASFVRSYEPVILKTKNREELRGIIRSESSSHIVLSTGPVSENNIDRDLIQSIRPDSISLMPAGYEAILSKGELSDLVAYLESCGRKADPPPVRNP